MAHFIWPCFAIDFRLRWGDKKSCISTQHELPLQSGDVKWISGHLGEKKNKNEFKRDRKCLKSCLPHTHPYFTCCAKNHTLSTLSQVPMDFRFLVAWPSLPPVMQRIVTIQWQSLVLKRRALEPAAALLQASRLWTGTRQARHRLKGHADASRAQETSSPGCLRRLTNLC